MGNWQPVYEIDWSKAFPKPKPDDYKYWLWYLWSPKERKELQFNTLIGKDCEENVKD